VAAGWNAGQQGLLCKVAGGAAVGAGAHAGQAAAMLARARGCGSFGDMKFFSGFGFLAFVV
jgi:hypothetical protein